MDWSLYNSLLLFFAAIVIIVIGRRLDELTKRIEKLEQLLKKKKK